MLTWTCLVPGKQKTLWEGGLYPIDLKFSADYPATAPLAFFPPGFHHVNVFDNGQVCLSIIGEAWRPSISIKEILLGIQDLLTYPNETDPANWDVNDEYINKRDRYEK